MGQEIRQAIMEVEEDPEMRVTLITGAGRGFCADADLQGGSNTFDGSNRPREENRSSLLKYYFSLKKPVIMAYNGPAVGVGVTMTLPYDIRIAGASSPRWAAPGCCPGSWVSAGRRN